MDVSAIGSAILNTTAFSPAPPVAAQSVGQFAGPQAQPGINLNSLSLSTGDQPLDGVRSAVSHLLEKRAALPGASRIGDNQLISVIDPAKPSGMVKEIGQSSAPPPSTMDNYAAVVEYATNVALVGMALHGVTHGISTLTSKGG